MRVDSYLDTSFLRKLYVKEKDSDIAIAWVRGNRGAIAVSSLSDVEMASSLHRSFDSQRASSVYKTYEQDKRLGVYQEIILDARVFLLAIRIAERNALQFRLRSLDALQLAVALHYSVNLMATFDERLAKASVAEGLRVFPAIA